MIHTYDAFAAFEAEIVRYGMHELPINEEPDLSAQEHEQEARDVARWAWDRKATITPYDEFVKGNVLSLLLTGGRGRSSGHSSAKSSYPADC